MKSVSGEKRAPFPRMCPACHRSLIPRRDVRSPLGASVLRAAAKGMIRSPDKKAERIKARKERKERRTELRAVWRADGIVAAATFFLDCAKTIRQAPVSDECPECLKLRGRAA